MSYATNWSPEYPSRRGVPSDEETEHRQEFQAEHPEVGFAFRDGKWIGYWADADCRPRHRTADTLGGLLAELRPLFP